MGVSVTKYLLWMFLPECKTRFFSLFIILKLRVALQLCTKVNMLCVGIFLNIEDNEVGCPVCMVRKNMFLKVTVSML
jgi:hypothetical protein